MPSDLNSLLDKRINESPSTQASSQKFNVNESLDSVIKKSEPLLKNNAAFIATEAIDGALGGTLRGAAQNPVKFLTSGVPGLQFTAGANIGPAISNFLPGENKPLPFPEEKKNLNKFLPGAENLTGELLGLAANIGGGLLGSPGRASLKAIDSAADVIKSNAAGANKVKKIQQAFFNFQKEATNKYGRALKGARKAEDFSALPKVNVKEVEAILEPISTIADDVAINIPSMRKIKNISKLATKDSSIDELLMIKQRLRRTMSVAEKQGRLVSDRSKVINQTVRNIDKAIQRKVPGIADANKEYALFSRIKEMVEKFEPRFGNMPSPFGTSSGEKFLRQVASFTEEEIKLLRKFEDAVSMGGKIVGAAKTAHTVDKMGRMVGKIAGLTATIGALRAVGADKLFFQVADVAN